MRVRPTQSSQSPRTNVRSGRLVVIDLGHHRNPIYLINSSVGNFYTTLAYFLDWSEKTSGNPAETARLRDALNQQRCIPPEELKPFWMDFVDFTLDGDPIHFGVALGAQGRLRPRNLPWR